MRRAAFVLVFVACSRGAPPAAEHEASAPGPESKIGEMREPERAGPRHDVPPTAAEQPPAAAAPPAECWSLVDEADRAFEVCITVTDAGRSLDERTTSESGHIRVTQGSEAVVDTTYASVENDGAAGSIYTTHRSATGDPLLVVRRTGDCEEKCVREIRLPTVRGEPVLTRECDVACAD